MAMKATFRNFLFISFILFMILIAFGFYLVPYLSVGFREQIDPNYTAQEKPSIKDIFPANDKPTEYKPTQLVPDDYDREKDQLIRLKMLNCYQIQDTPGKVNCYEAIYLNEQPELVEEKKECNRVSGQQKQECFDAYYFDLADTLSVFCAAIQNTELREGCQASRE